MTGKGIEWPAAEMALAKAEGWGIFAVEGDWRRRRIERTDNPEIFTSDGAAARHVLKSAKEGKWLAGKALEMITVDVYDASKTVIYTIDGGVGDVEHSPGGIDVVKVDYGTHPEAEIATEDGIIFIEWGKQAS